VTEPRCILITDDYLPHLGGSRLYCHKVATVLAGALAVVTREREGGAEFDASAPYPLRRVRLHGAREYGVALAGEALDGARLARGALAGFPNVRTFLAGEVNPAAFAAAFAAWRRCGAYGVIIHDEPLTGASALEARLRRRVIRRAGALIVSSRFAEGRAREISGDRMPIFYAPPGVDTTEFSPGAADPAVLSRYGAGSKPFVLSVGRLVDYKNVSAVIEAIAALRERGIRLVVVGEGPERTVLEGQAKRLGVDQLVMFAGRVQRNELIQLYRAALAYVFPTRRSLGCKHEGIGMAALEAAGSGCPVIASTVTSATDFLEDGRTGLFFDPEDKDALVRAVRLLLDSPDTRARMARECADTVRARFTWEKTAAVVEKAIQHLR
jgi:glycosyltransferase involved in cell wall biosynthesis